MLGAIHPMLVMEYLMGRPFPLESHEVDGLHPRARSSGRRGVEPVDANLFGEEIQLMRHGE